MGNIMQDALVRTINLSAPLKEGNEDKAFFSISFRSGVHYSLQIDVFDAEYIANNPEIVRQVADLFFQQARKEFEAAGLPNLPE